MSAVWRVGNDNFGGLTGELMGVLIVDEQGRDVAESIACPVDHDLAGMDEDEQECRKRARLIAAAPQLAEACQAALRYDAAIQRHAAEGKSWVEGDDLDALYSDWIDKARAAIAAAEGSNE